MKIDSINSSALASGGSLLLTMAVFTIAGARLSFFSHSGDAIGDEYTTIRTCANTADSYKHLMFHMSQIAGQLSLVVT